MKTSTRKAIREREHAIMMYGYDVWGYSASSNVDKMHKLEKEIENLKMYGTAEPNIFQRIKHKLGVKNNV